MASNPYDSSTDERWLAPTEGRTVYGNGYDASKFKEVVGRDANDQETQYYSNAGPNWLDEVKKNTPGYTPPQPQAGNGAGSGQPGQTQGGDPWGGAGGYEGWIDQRLQATGNTSDSPQYWKQQMSKDPKAMAGDPSAIAWWKDAIDRADGSSLVASGQLQKRQGGGGPPGVGGFGGSGGANGSLMKGALGVPQANALFDKLMGRADQSLNIDPRTDPIMRAQTDAFDAARQRGDRNTISAIAESGGPNTNLEAVRRSAGEASGQATAGFQAQLSQNELTARRQEIQQALSGAQGLLTSQQQMALQEELSNLDRAYQYAALGQNESQFARTLGQHAYEFDNNDQWRHDPLSWA